jgi:hypothetical protein
MGNKFGNVLLVSFFYFAQCDIISKQVIISGYFSRLTNSSLSHGSTAQIGKDPNSLEKTVVAWNQACAAGNDSEYGRDPKKNDFDSNPAFLCDRKGERMMRQTRFQRSLQVKIR